VITVSQSIFKAYDIRGIVGKTLDIGIARQIGQLSGRGLSAALASGLQRAGVASGKPISTASPATSSSPAR
jgi:phosphomannomutase/phosphoglucomutase